MECGGNATDATALAGSMEGVGGKGRRKAGAPESPRNVTEPWERRPGKSQEGCTQSIPS